MIVKDPHLKYHGTEAIVRNFTLTDQDEYGDYDREVEEIETKVSIRRNHPARQRGDVHLDESGIDPRLEASMWIDREVPLEGAEGDTPPSEIEVLGLRYEVHSIDDRGWEVKKAFVRRK